MELTIAITVLIFAIILLFFIVGKIRDYDDGPVQEEISKDVSSIDQSWLDGRSSEELRVGELERKLKSVEEQYQKLKGVFTAWEADKDKTKEKIALSGVSERVAEQTNQTQALAKLLSEIQKQSSDLQKDYAALKNTLQQTLDNQVSLLPTAIQPMIAQYKQENETIAQCKNNFILKMKEKESSIAALITRYEKLFKQKEEETLFQQIEIGDIKTKIQANFTTLQNELDSFLKSSSETVHNLDKEIGALAVKKEEAASSLETRRLNERQRINNIRLELNREIELLKQELHTLEARNESVLNEKEEELLALNANVVELENQLSGKRTMFERMKEKFNRRINYKQQQALERKKQIEDEQNKIITAKKAEYDRLSGEVARAEGRLKQELESELEVYKEEEESLIKARDEYKKRLEGESTAYEQKRSVYEQEISQLKQKISDTEKKWEQESASRKDEYEHEKGALFSRLTSAREDIENERVLRQEQIERMKSEFKLVNETSAKNLQELKVKFKQAEGIFNKNKEDLLAQIEDSTRRLEIEKTAHEEQSGQKVAELNSLRRGYEDIQRKIDTEKAELEKKVQEQKMTLESELRDLQKIYADELELTENEKKALEYQLQTLGMEHKQKENESRLALEKKQKESDNACRELKSEIQRVQSEINKKSELLARTIREADAEIKKLTHDITIRESELNEIRARSQNLLKKVTAPVLHSIDKMKEKINEHRQKRLEEIKIKNEQIQTLKVRLALRDEMLGNNLKKREESSENISKRLKIYLDKLEEKGRKNSNEGEAILKPMAAKIQYLKQQQSTIADQVEREKARQKQAAEKLNAMEKEIRLIEKDTPKDFMALEKVLELKENEIVMLTREIYERDRSLAEGESIISAVITDQFRSKDEIEKQAAKNNKEE